MRFFIAYNLLFFNSIALFAQPGVTLPVQFQQFQNTYILSNPAATGSYSKWDLFVNHQEVMGAFKGIRRFSFVGNTRLGSSENKNFHSIGLGLIGKRDGPYIHKNWIYIPYAFHISFTEKLKGSMGASVQLVNYNLEGSIAGAGGSATGVTGNVGLMIYDDHFHLGASVNQLLTPKLQPVDEIFQLERFIQMGGFADYNFSLGSKLSFVAAANCLVYRTVDLHMLGLLKYDKIIRAGAGYAIDRGMFYYFGLDSIPWNSQELYLMVSYFSPLAESKELRVNSLEIGLGIRYRK